MQDRNNVAVLGTGVIGASWAALFLAFGKRVTAFEPTERARESANSFVGSAWPDLIELGFATSASPGRVSFCETAADAVTEADFVQECLPEVLAIKHGLYREIEPHLRGDAVVASSASGLTLSELQKPWNDPRRLVLGHPFNPPHLVPLVEVLGNEQSDEDAVAAAEAFYASVGKTTIRLQKEVPGHVANRLQAALWREAIHLAREGVASVEDIDRAVTAGPGLRWAFMGPTGLFNLAAGDGGIREFCSRYDQSFARWWGDLGRPDFDDETRLVVERGMRAASDADAIRELSGQRDRKLIAVLRAVSCAGESC